MEDSVPARVSVWSERLPRLTALLVVAALLTLGFRALGYSPTPRKPNERALPAEMLSWQQEVETWRQLAAIEQAADSAADPRRAQLLREGCRQLREALLAQPVDRRLSAARERTDGDESSARHELAVADGAVEEIGSAARNLLQWAEQRTTLAAYEQAGRQGMELVLLPTLAPNGPGPWFAPEGESQDQLWCSADADGTLRPVERLAQPPR